MLICLPAVLIPGLVWDLPGMRRRLPSQPWIQTRVDMYHRFSTSAAAQCPHPAVADVVSGSIGQQPLHTPHRRILKSTLMPGRSIARSHATTLSRGQESEWHQRLCLMSSHAGMGLKSAGPISGGWKTGAPRASCTLLACQGSLILVSVLAWRLRCMLERHPANVGWCQCVVGQLVFRVEGPRD